MEEEEGGGGGGGRGWDKLFHSLSEESCHQVRNLVTKLGILSPSEESCHQVRNLVTK